MLWTIVVPLDGTDFAAHALTVGIALVTAASASIRVIRIASTDAELAWTYDDVYDHAKGVVSTRPTSRSESTPSPSRSCSTWRPTTTT